MPTFQPTPDLTMHYEIDDFTDPWRTPETVLLLHGNAESGAAWYGWVPHLALHYRVVRADMRGFGASTPMPRDFPWTLDRLIGDFIGLMDRLDSRRQCAKAPPSAPLSSPTNSKPRGWSTGRAAQWRAVSVAISRRTASSGGSSSWAARRCRPRSAS